MRTVRVGAALVLGLAAAPLAAQPAVATEPGALVERMGQALQGLEYEGIAVYLHDGQMDTLQVSRRIGSHGPVERLITLNGDRRELVRERGQLRCLTPGGAVDAAAIDGWGLLDAAAARLAEARKHYAFSIAGRDRVAGFDAVVVDAIPQEPGRYAYRLWIDRDSGMLLASTLREPPASPVVEQLVFTQLRVNAVDTAAVAAPTLRSPAPQMPRSDGWLVPGLPAGFRLVATPDAPAAHRQWVYSDGLASISIYIEPPGAGLLGPARRGAVNAFGRAAEGAHIVVVGDVPAATVMRIAESVQPEH
jgi:sigma-E factor negative regulatory protein RseB